MVIVVGDLLSTDGLDALPLLAARHEVLCVAVRDPLERRLPNAGLLQIAGVGVIDSSDARLRRRYERARNESEAAVRAAVARCGAGLVELEAGDDPLPSLMAWLRRRSGKRRIA
jgi:uncharacterized protein (DUF58 family)